MNHLQQILKILTMILQLIQHPLNTNQDFLNHSLTAVVNAVFKDMRTAVPLKYLSNF